MEGKRGGWEVERKRGVTCKSRFPRFCPVATFPPFTFRSEVSAALKKSFPSRFVDIMLGSREEERWRGREVEWRGGRGKEESLRKGGEGEMSN